MTFEEWEKSVFDKAHSMSAEDIWNAACREGKKDGMLRAAEIAEKFVEDNHAWRIVKGKPLKMVTAVDAIRMEANNEQG